MFCVSQDVTRTGTYHAAITENRADFEGKAVMDVGAGSGILSLFAAQVGGWQATTHALARGRQANYTATNGGSSSSSRVSQLPQPQARLLLQPQPPGPLGLSPCRMQAGARKVYAVEASGMANFARQLAERNTSIGKAVQVGGLTVCWGAITPCLGAHPWWLLRQAAGRGCLPACQYSTHIGITSCDTAFGCRLAQQPYGSAARSHCGGATAACEHSTL